MGMFRRGRESKTGTRRVEERCLDAGSVPAAAAGGDCCIGASCAAVHDPEAEKSRSEEEDGSQEEECDISLEFIAASTSGDAVPVPDATAVGAVIVREETESDHEASEEEEINRPVHEACEEWEEEEQREKDANCGDDFGVDEALLVPC